MFRKSYKNLHVKVITVEEIDTGVSDIASGSSMMKRAGFNPNWSTQSGIFQGRDMFEFNLDP